MKAVLPTDLPLGRMSRLRRLLAVTVTGALAVLGLSAAGTAHAADSTYYVATTGSDSDNGTSLSTPFQTISRCAAVATAGDSCLIRGGTYRETVTPKASGTATARITFARYNDEQVTVSGADRISGWASYQGAIYKAPATLAPGYGATETPANDDLAANQVFADGIMLPEAQYPAPGADATRPASISIPSITKGSGTRTGTLSDPALPALSPPGALAVIFTGGWTTASGTVTASGAGSLSYALPASDRYLYPPNLGNKKYRVLGSLSLLTEPGEWFFDSAAKQLYVWAPGGGIPSGIEAKRRNYAFDLRGRTDITVSGIGVTASTVITDASSTGIVLDSITGSYLSHFQTQQYNAALPYGGVYDAAHRLDTGIILNGSGNVLENSVLHHSAGNGVALAGNDNTVRNNLIHDVAYGGTYTSGITMFGGSTGELATGNTIYATGRDGININTNVAALQKFHGNRLSYNDVSGYGTLQRDLGGIYTCCEIDWSGSRIDHNTVHDPSSGTAIYLDNGTYNTQVDHNVTWNSAGEGLNINPSGNSGSGSGFLIANNTFAGPVDSVHGMSARADARFANNIYTMAANVSADAVSDHNIGKSVDPLFVDRAAADFRLAAGSPALNAGIAIPGVTVNSTGSADIGAYESGAGWASGCSMPGCHSRAAVSVDDAATGTTAISYHGSNWRHCTGCSAGAALYGGSNSWDSTAGDTAVLTFTGTAVAYSAVRDSVHGIAEVSVDGGPVVKVDLYSPTRKGDATVWSSGPLAAGSHTLTIRVTGTRNPSSKGAFVTIDRLVYTA